MLDPSKHTKHVQFEKQKISQKKSHMLITNNFM